MKSIPCPECGEHLKVESREHCAIGVRYGIYCTGCQYYSGMWSSIKMLKERVKQDKREIQGEQP